MAVQAGQALDFDYGGNRFRLLPDYHRNPTTEDAGQFTDAEVATTLQIVREFWELYLRLGFTTFGIEADGRTVYTVAFNESIGIPGWANNGAMTLRGKSLRDSLNPTLSGPERLSLLTFYRSVILHELFHAVTFAVEDPFQSLQAFTEGGADAAKFLLMSPSERADVGVASYDAYLDNPGMTMWDRESPGNADVGDTRSGPTLWWVYFADQLGTRSEEPGPKSDALRDLLRDGWPTAGRLEARYTARRVAGQFLGNGQCQFMFDSDEPTRRFGLVSPSASFGGSGELHIRISHNERFGAGGWRVRPGDRAVGVGDLVGNGRDQVVLQSQDPMYLGVTGYNHTDGEWFRTAMTTYQSAPVGERWGGWKLRSGDRVLSVGRFSAAARDHILIASERGPESAYIGIIGLSEHGEKENVTAVREDAPFGLGGWTYSATDSMVGHGPLRGNGRDQIVLQSATSGDIGIVGVDDSGDPQTLAEVREGERFGGGWLLKSGDAIRGVGRLLAGDRAHMIIESMEGNLGIVGLSAAGELETGPVVAPGQPFGADGWVWNRGDVIVGIGNFLNNGKQQFVVSRDRRFGVIDVPAGGFATADSTETWPDIHGLDEVWAVGDFAGLGTDQIFGVDGAGGNGYLKSLSYEGRDLDDIGHWRHGRFVLHESDGVFGSTHYQLEQFMSEKGDSRSFKEFWRDFTVSNRTKDLTDAPTELTYSLALPTKAVASEPYPATTERVAINRWAARYFDVSPENSTRTVQIRGQVVDSPFAVFWTVVVATDAGLLRTVIRQRGNSFGLPITLSPGDEATLIVTTTFANVEVEIQTID